MSDLYGLYATSPAFEFVMPKFKNNETLFYTQQLLVALDLREMEADFGVLPFPKYSKEQKEHYTWATDHFLKYVWIPTTNTEPVHTANILQAMAYYSQQMVIPALYDITITNKALRDEDSLEMLELINRNRIYDLITIYNWGETLAIYNSIYRDRRNDLASKYEANLGKIETAMQKTIDDLLG